MNKSPSVAVFLGPSLPRQQARQILDADYYPPASKGDIYRIMASGVKTIILIDGIFHGKPSIWHRELIHAIEEGIQVFGASSMGALRAAELEPFGMVGHGQVFAWYRDGLLESDDEVALLHGTEESGFVSMSEPLVNIRYTLLQAVEANYLTAEQARYLIDEVKQLYYPQRSYQQMLQSQVIQDLPSENATRLKHYLLHHKINIKQIDAMGVLKLYASLSQEQIPKPKGRFCSPSIDLQFQRLKMTGFVTASGLRVGKDILQLLKQDVELQGRMRSQLAKRCFLLRWARQNQISFPIAQWQSYFRQWQQKYNIVNEAEWLQSNGLTSVTYQEILAEYFLVDWIVQQGPDYFGIKWNYQTALSAELRFTGNVGSQVNMWPELSQRRLIVEWAEQNGVVCPETELNSYLEKLPQLNNLIDQEQHQAWLVEKAMEAWIVDKEPQYFGISWSFPQALFQELQITGKAAQILVVNSH
ncbi:TfuA-like protein [Anabaena sp. CA = ATCC 33047]|uniref:TfuA-like protein n=1 Tax=Anabaena sp. (strain CA / ATCC 33047) TaxID=52271 RepID=UPI0008373C8E|nr:TfuA-like protein [Anabaena sp. CA = ATCC 33047]